MILQHDWAAIDRQLAKLRQRVLDRQHEQAAQEAGVPDDLLREAKREEWSIFVCPRCGDIKAAIATDHSCLGRPGAEHDPVWARRVWDPSHRRSSTRKPPNPDKKARPVRLQRPEDDLSSQATEPPDLTGAGPAGEG